MSSDDFFSHYEQHYVTISPKKDSMPQTRHRNFGPPSDTSGKQFTIFYHGFTAGTLATPSALPAAKRTSDMLIPQSSRLE
jgi:hypothetical protein